MMRRQEAAGTPAVQSLGPRHRAVAVGLMAYAVVAPLAVAALAGPLTLHLVGALALGTSLLGPALATMLVAWRGLGTIMQALASHPDSEPQQAILRIFVTGAALAYIGGLAAAGMPPSAVQPLLAIDVGGAVIAWLLLLHLIVAPTGHRRRVVGMLSDIGLITAFLHWGDSAAAPWVSAYLWVTCGCGLRFGPKLLTAAALLSAVGFATVCATTRFWHGLPIVVAAIYVTLAVVPLYAAALSRRLAEARATAEETIAVRGRLFAVLSHELRTPLNTLIGVGSLLARARLDAEQREMLGTMQLSARTLVGLINDLLDLSKIEAGQVVPKSESFVLREVLGGAVAILRPQAEAKGLEIALIIDPRLPHVCHGASLQLRQVVMNLLANAIRFTPRGHVSIAANLAEREERTVRLRLTVRDEGIGMTPAAREHIFAQADKTESARAGGLGLTIAKDLVELMGGVITVESEVGAGTTIAVELSLGCDEAAAVRPPDLAGRRIIIVSPDRELANTLQTWLRVWHGETQWYDRGADALAAVEVGRATTRHLLLIDGRSDPLANLSLSHRLATAAMLRPTVIFIAPQQASEAVAGLAATQLAAVIEEPVSEAALASAVLSVLAAAAEEPAEPSPAETARQPGLTILVADDNGSNREVLKNLLQRAGHQVELASDGGAALAALDQGRFDLALLDLDMPGNGDAVAKLYRLRHPGAGLPLVALAADASGETQARCRDAGFDAVLTKPLDATELLAAIDKIGAERAARGAPSIAEAPGVTPISAHPRFSPEAVEVVHEQTIESLRGLGGNDFVAEVVETFRADAARLLPRLRDAVARGDLAEFGDAVHSLRSGAANVGGVRLCQTLSALEEVSVKELRQAGAAYLEKIESELGRLELTLDQFARAHRLG